MNLRVGFWYCKVDTNHEIRNHCKYKRNRKVLLVFTNPANLSLNCQKKKCAYFKTNLRTHECLKMRNAHIPLSSFHGWYIECLVVFFLDFYQALQFDALIFKICITIGHFLYSDKIFMCLNMLELSVTELICRISHSWAEDVINYFGCCQAPN